MPNSIPIEQNTDKQLDRLAAQRELYNRAKLVQRVHVFLSVPAVVVWSVVVLVNPHLKVYSALWAIAVMMLDIAALTPWQDSLKSMAAKIQETFDCDVLHLPWQKLKIGRRPDAETISASASRFRSSDGNCDLLKDWYPKEVGVLPLEQARIICQRANCRWDAELRRRYSLLVIVVMAVLCALIVILSVIGDFTLERFILTGLMPLLPLLTLSLRRFREHRKGADRADRLKEAAEDLWQAALSGGTSTEKLTDCCRELQDEIFEHRRSSSLIPSWLYSWLRDAHEEQMNRAANELIEEGMQRN